MGSSFSTSQPSSSPSTALTPPPSSPPPELEPTPRRPLLQQPGPRLIAGGLLFTLASGLITRRALIRRRLPLSQLSNTPTVRPAQAPRMPAEMRSQNTATTTQSTTASAVEGGSVATRLGSTETSSLASPASTSSPSPSQSHQTTSSPPPPDADPTDDLNNSGPLLALEALTLATLNVLSLSMLFSGSILYYFDIQSLEDLRRKVRGGLGVDGTGRSEKEVEEEMEEWVVGVLARKGEKDAARDVVNARVREQRSFDARNERGKVRGLGETKGWWG